jgi:hypothetical protein
VHAGNTLDEIVDHVVALQFAVAHDVDAGDLLIFNRRLAGCLVHIIEIVAADPARQEVVLRALKPGWHRVAANNCCRQDW